MKRLCGWLCFAALMISVAGCGRSGSTGVRSVYGPSVGVVGRTSLNGFGAMRNAYVQSGFKSRDIFRLNSRSKRSDVIFWTPQVYNPIPGNVSRWMESWLGQGKRTLVYVIPDSGSEADYWPQARDSAPPKQRMEYRRRLARKINERSEWQTNRSELRSNGWFRAVPQVQTRKFGNKLSQRGDETEKQLTEFALLPYDGKQNQATTNTSMGATGPASFHTSYWDVAISDTNVDFSVVKSTTSGDAIVAELTAKKWKDSKVIVVAGGSLITNFAMTRQVNVDIANDIVQRSKQTAAKSNPVVGFLLSDSRPIQISEQATKQSMMSGMEFLTVWPLSLVTIHATLLGFVVCMVLFPIFGRPKTVKRGSQNDFGDHLDAVAGLMDKARGEQYARRRISEYMRRMKGETSGKWVLKEPTRKPANQSDKTKAQSQST